MVLIADITDTETGTKVGVPVDVATAELAKTSAYWRAYLFRRGSGVPLDCISSGDLEAAKLTDFDMTIMKKGKIIWPENHESTQALKACSARSRRSTA